MSDRDRIADAIDRVTRLLLRTPGYEQAMLDRAVITESETDGWSAVIARVPHHSKVVTVEVWLCRHFGLPHRCYWTGIQCENSEVIDVISARRTPFHLRTDSHLDRDGHFLAPSEALSSLPFVEKYTDGTNFFGIYDCAGELNVERVAAFFRALFRPV